MRPGLNFPVKCVLEREREREREMRARTTVTSFFKFQGDQRWLTLSRIHRYPLLGGRKKERLIKIRDETIKGPQIKLSRERSRLCRVSLSVQPGPVESASDGPRSIRAACPQPLLRFRGLKMTSLVNTLNPLTATARNFSGFEKCTQTRMQTA